MMRMFGFPWAALLRERLLPELDVLLLAMA